MIYFGLWFKKIEGQELVSGETFLFSDLQDSAYIAGTWQETGAHMYAFSEFFSA